MGATMEEIVIVGITPMFLQRHEESHRVYSGFCVAGHKIDLEHVA